MSSQPVALVTGASSGIGLACAQRLSGAGYSVYGTSRSADFQPDGFAGIVLDVDSDQSVHEGVADVIRRGGRIDSLVNSAGYGLAGAIEETSIDEARAQFETNFFGVLRMCKEVLPYMRRQRYGSIVNIGSIAGVMGIPFQGLYSASKFALEGLTESLRQEVSPFGIRVVMVDPGDVKSNISRNRKLADVDGEDSAYAEDFRRAMHVIEKSEREGASADDVARLVERVQAMPAPRVRYFAGHLAQRMSTIWKKALPSRLFERGVMSHYGIPPRRRPQPDIAAKMTSIPETYPPKH